MKVLIDINVVLDVWLMREPHWADSAAVLARVEAGEIEGWLSPNTITTLHYLGRKALGEVRARRMVSTLLKLCRLGQLNSRVFGQALESDVADFEDAVQEAVALQSKLDVIITRNVRDFRRARVEVKTPSELLRT